MRAIYLAQIDGYDGKRAGQQIIDAINARANKFRDGTIKNIGDGRYLFDDSHSQVEIEIRYEDDHTLLEIHGRTGRVMQTESDLLKIVDRLTLS